MATRNSITDRGGMILWNDDEVQRRRVYVTAEPTAVGYSEDDFFATIDAGMHEGDYVRVECYGRDGRSGLYVCYVAAAAGFVSVDDVIAAIRDHVVGKLAPESEIFGFWAQPGSRAKLASWRQERGLRGNTDRALRERIRAEKPESSYPGNQ